MKNDKFDEQIGLAKDFMEWRSNQKTTNVYGRILYDIPGYYKFLDESELFEFYIKNVKK